VCREEVVQGQVADDVDEAGDACEQQGDAFFPDRGFGLSGLGN
jgi:hypothetical protein